MLVSVTCKVGKGTKLYSLKLLSSLTGTKAGPPKVGRWMLGFCTLTEGCSGNDMLIGSKCKWAEMNALHLFREEVSWRTWVSEEGKFRK